MKKLFIALSFIAVSIFACKKNTNLVLQSMPTNKTTYENALEFSKKINNKYKENNNSIRHLFRSANSKAAVSVMADVAAAGTAAKTMGGLWTTAPWGTIASVAVTVCAGASASILAHDAQKSPVRPSIPNSGLVYNQVNSKLINHVFVLDTNSFNNPFDSIGFRHNELVKRYYTTPNNYSSPNANSFLFNTLNLTAEENNGLAYTSMTSLTDLLLFQYANPIEDSTSLRLYLNQAYMLYANNQFLIDFNNTLLAGMYACTTYDELINLAHDYEGYYVSNFQGTDDERRVILISLATMKYSAKLWKVVNEI